MASKKNLQIFSIYWWKLICPLFDLESYQKSIIYDDRFDGEQTAPHEIEECVSE